MYGQDIKDCQEIKKVSWMMRDRRRTNVVGNFQDGQSALMLVSARLRYLANKKLGHQTIYEYGFVKRQDYW
jgi:hypothetical protein